MQQTERDIVISEWKVALDILDVDADRLLMRRKELEYRHMFHGDLTPQEKADLIRYGSTVLDEYPEFNCDDLFEDPSVQDICTLQASVPPLSYEYTSSYGEEKVQALAQDYNSEDNNPLGIMVRLARHCNAFPEMRDACLGAAVTGARLILCYKREFNRIIARCSDRTYGAKVGIMSGFFLGFAFDYPLTELAGRDYGPKYCFDSWNYQYEYYILQHMDTSDVYDFRFVSKSWYSASRVIVQARSLLYYYSYHQDEGPVQGFDKRSLQDHDLGGSNPIVTLTYECGYCRSIMCTECTDGFGMTYKECDWSTPCSFYLGKIEIQFGSVIYYHYHLINSMVSRLPILYPETFIAICVFVSRRFGFQYDLRFDYYADNFKFFLVKSLGEVIMKYSKTRLPMGRSSTFRWRSFLFSTKFRYFKTDRERWRSMIASRFKRLLASDGISEEVRVKKNKT